ncbi:hypothetical protein [Zunongwangia pacifica]|uniref:Uncharacterized protein n=1 Tax=Zunongwangia pacifica TaxID=2911062 RepID=A0A9X1ZXE3_9FLAO|nr:hypothetical protein [Zunongwangia pacifica]MCL6220930.1 hypothetical protein [Zunongwangia pacifica]
MTIEEKSKFLRNNIEPLSDLIYGKGYRASAYLTDGTYIPCVKFLNPEMKTEFAIKRFDQESKKESAFKNSSKNNYKRIVESFVTGENNLNEYAIDHIELSPFAFPKNILEQIHGETTMSWTGFCAKMNDGKVFGFGSRFLFDFFQMPEG